MTKVVQLRGLIVHHHLIIRDQEVYLIDGGFLGGVARIEKTLARHGLDFSHVKALILTHGHLDHTLNVSKIKQLTQCMIHAPLLDQAHVEGRHLGKGLNRICGWIEALGRFILRYKAPLVDEWFRHGDTICGYKIIGLPGHTVGHCGVLIEEQQTLIAADLFANHFGTPEPPPFIFNDEHQDALESIRSASGLELTGVFLNHGREMSPEEALASLRQLSDALAL